ncbi:MAG: dihydroorotate dehydrogenase [Actinomycetota bacterium]
MAVKGVSPQVDLNGLVLPGAVLVASGCFGSGRELGPLFDRSGVGGVVSRTVTAAPRKGAPSPRAAETPSGLLSMVGLQNPGVDAFVADDLLHMASMSLPVIVSVAGGSLEEYVRVTAALDGAPGVVALEVYLAGPDEELDGQPFTARPERCAEVTGAVARRAQVPVFAKLPALQVGLVEAAGACVRAGAHGLTMIDGVPGMAVNADELAPALGSVQGYLSGPAVRPLALRAIHQVANAMPEVPIMGVGGVWTGSDAAELLLAGAWAIQVGTAMLVDPAGAARVASGLVGYLRGKGLTSPADIRGRLRAPAAGIPPPGAAGGAGPEGAR